jgi:hypothetical protein
MEPDDTPSRPDDLLDALVRQDLDPLSVAELDAVIALPASTSVAFRQRRNGRGRVQVLDATDISSDIVAKGSRSRGPTGVL